MQSPDTSGDTPRSLHSFVQPPRVAAPHVGRPSQLHCRLRLPNSTLRLQPRRELLLHRPRPLRLRGFRLRVHTRPPESAAITKTVLRLRPDGYSALEPPSRQTG